MRYNDGDIIYLCGDRGVGKTTFLAKIAKGFYTKGHPVYANTEIKGTHLFDLRQFGKVKYPIHSVIMIDEAGIEFNSRDWKSLDKAVNRFIKKQRHHRVMIVICSQTYNDADKTWRDNSTKLYILKRWGNFTVGKRIVNELVLVPSQNGNNGYMGFDLHYAGLLTAGSRIICYRPLYYKMFDSWVLDKEDILPEVQAKYIPTDKERKKLENAQKTPTPTQ